MKFWFVDQFKREVREINVSLTPDGEYRSDEAPYRIQPLVIGTHIFHDELAAYDVLIEKLQEFKDGVSQDIMRAIDERNSKGVSVQRLTELIEECGLFVRDVRDLVDPSGRKERIQRFLATVHDEFYRIRSRLESDTKTIHKLRKLEELRQNPVIVDQSS